jgi:hypothetical protein
LPRRLVEPAVEPDLARRAERAQHVGRPRLTGGGGHGEPERERGERAEPQLSRASRARTSSSNLRISPCV